MLRIGGSKMHCPINTVSQTQSLNICELDVLLLIGKCLQSWTTALKKSLITIYLLTIVLINLMIKINSINWVKDLVKSALRVLLLGE